MPLITDDPRNPRQPGFKSTAQRIRQQHGRIVGDAAAFDDPGRTRNASLPGNRQHGIHFRHRPPEPGELFRRQDRDPGIRPPAADRPDRRHRHAGIAEPIGGTDQDFKALQIFHHHAWQQSDAPFIAGEQEIRIGGFPAVMHPEPVRRRVPDAFLQRLIHPRRGLVDIHALGHRNRLSAHEAPAGGTDGFDGERHHRGSGAPTQEGWQRGGGREAAKKRAPDSPIPRMLIGKDAEGIAVTQPARRSLEPILTVKKGADRPAAAAQHMGIQIRIAEGLIHAGGLHSGAEDIGLRKHLPVSHVTKGINQTFALLEHHVYFFHASRLQPRQHRRFIHVGNLETAQQIGRQSGKMLPRQPIQFRRRTVVAESDLQIPPHQAAITRKNQTAGPAQHPAHLPDHGQRKEPAAGFHRPVYEIREPVGHGQAKRGGGLIPRARWPI